MGALEDHQQPDCHYHAKVYKYGEKWPNNCADCECKEAGTVICGPDVCDKCTWGSPKMYYDHKAFFVDGCKTCECFDGIVSCTDQTEVLPLPLPSYIHQHTQHDI